MSKRIQFCISISLATAFVFLCWVLPGQLIGIQQDSMMCSPVLIRTYVPASDAPSTDDEDRTFTIFQITNILSEIDKWPRKYADPSGQQLSMEEAITTAQTVIAQFKASGILPENLADNTGTVSASMDTLDRPAQEFIEPEYGLWTVRFEHEDYDLSLTLNAFTGQCWSVNFLAKEEDMVSGMRVPTLVKNYLEYLNLDQPYLIDSRDYDSFVHFSDVDVSIWVSLIQADRKNSLAFQLFWNPRSRPAAAPAP